MKIASLWDKLPQDIEFRIYGHVLAKRLSLSSHDKYMLMMLLDSQFCIHGHVLAKRLSLHRHDKHTLKAKTEMKLVCAFNPPVTGREIHDEDGAYVPPED